MLQAPDPSTLTTFANAAAGHDGVLSDPSETVIIKPCHPKEIAFYEAANASHPALARWLPTYMGTLSLNQTASTSSAGGPSAPTNTDGAAASADTNATAQTAATLAPGDVGPMHGKKLDTDLNVVLANVAGGFKKPNILDVKLGARLWDTDAPPEKRARLDKVAAESTSASLGFRIAGMKLWRGDGQRKEEEFTEWDDKSKYLTFNKLYGRKFSAQDVAEGFKTYFGVIANAQEDEEAKAIRLDILKRFAQDVKDIQKVFENEESRMVSASLLFVYEGEPTALRSAKAEEESRAKQQRKVDEDDDEDDEPPKVAEVRLIDFAHAEFTPGQGPDENALEGIRSTAKILSDLVAELEKAAS